ncbi:hypothetical protein EXN66_Car006178 [Channa argus]|uniref:Uncharacterized protein n=1 Tax=Channa argus TaxID=215402 RepID=A0A6G1PJP8_CHAAH|nr:hypothetical protein EXN66_Car006178 [Channa argus]
MNLTCYSSKDPAAENFRLVFDHNSDHENLCTRGDLQAPLPFCSSSALHPDSHCLVCRSDGLVYILIRDLAKGANVMMEALGQVPIKRSADQLSWASVFTMVLFVLGVAGVIVYAVCKLWRSRRQRQQRDRAAAVDPTEEEALAEDAV